MLSDKPCAAQEATEEKKEEDSTSNTNSNQKSWNIVYKQSKNVLLIK